MVHALSNCNWGFPDLDWSISKTGDDDDEPVCQCVILESLVWDFITVSNVAAVANATTHQPSMDSCAANCSRPSSDICCCCCCQHRPDVFAKVEMTKECSSPLTSANWIPGFAVISTASFVHCIFIGQGIASLVACEIDFLIPPHQRCHC